ncbi:MAG TPA: hypothetical protein VF635_15640 [Propionibacteriaceae bacterium]
MSTDQTVVRCRSDDRGSRYLWAEGAVDYGRIRGRDYVAAPGEASVAAFLDTALAE